jgi:prepilin-type N-terminal cleavage/methylation domain-containing protein
MTALPKARRAGFTMVELLVVILIIGVLASLLLAGFGAARRTARIATATAEMAQVANAVGAFKAKFNTGFIPAFRPGTTTGARFRLLKSYSPNPETYPEFAYLRQLFPQISEIDNGLPPAMAGELTPNQMMLFFLAGVNQQGFSTNRAMPFTPSTSSDNRIGPFLEVSPGKIVGGHYVDPWGTPYAYFAFDPSLHNYPSAGWPRYDPAHPADPAFTDLHPTENVPMLATVPPPPGVKVLTPYVTPGTPSRALNQKGFQIVSAGPDQIFGVGGTWIPGQGEYISNGPGADDLSNFNNGPLGQQSQ